MPWVRAKLRGQLIYARADSSGELLATNGTVEIRYKANDGRAYRARKENLELAPGEAMLPDEAMGDGAPVQKADAATSAAGGTKSKSAANSPATKTNGMTPSAQGGRYAAYTDGACTGNPGPAGLGVILVAPDGTTMTEGSEYLGEATNNIAELTAIGRALERSPPSDPIVVYTDSQYAIGVLSKGWKAKANKELIEGIRAQLVGRTVHLEYVRGHAGIPLNERADELARGAITNRATVWSAPSA